MNQRIVFVSILLVSAFFCVSAVAGSITQKIVTVSIPMDYRSTEAYKVEFAIPEGATAFNFTLWGATKTWGIVDISSGAHKEVYSSSGGAYGDAPVNDAESSRRVTDPLPETGTTDPLSRLTLYPGSYIIWMEGSPGASMTLQYNLRTTR
jgi:hypothetical protein